MKQLHARRGDTRSRKCTTEFYLRHFVITRSQDTQDTQDTQEIKASTDKLPKKKQDNSCLRVRERARQTEKAGRSRGKSAARRSCVS